MSQADVVKSAWQAIRGEAFSPLLLNSQRPEHIRQRKLIRYALAMELGWSNYCIAKAECEAGNMAANYDWRKRNVKHSVNTIEKAVIGSDEYRRVTRALSGDSVSLLDQVAELMEENSLTLAAMIVLLAERSELAPEVVQDIKTEAKTLTMAQLRQNLTEKRP